MDQGPIIQNKKMVPGPKHLSPKQTLHRGLSQDSEELESSTQHTLTMKQQYSGVNLYCSLCLPISHTCILLCRGTINV